MDYDAGKEVQLFEVEIDFYDRVMEQVYDEDIWFHGVLVRGGYAYVYPKYAIPKTKIKSLFNT